MWGSGRFYSHPVNVAYRAVARAAGSVPRVRWWASQEPRVHSRVVVPGYGVSPRLRMIPVRVAATSSKAVSIHSKASSSASRAVRPSPIRGEDQFR